MTVFAGDNVYASDVNALPKGIIARYSRGLGGTVSASAGTETGVIRVDSIPVRNGYSYRVTLPTTRISFNATSAASAIGRVRGSTSGTATTASTQLDAAEIRVNAYTNSTSFSPELPLIGYFHSTVTGTLSVIYTIQRTDGTSTVSNFASTAQVTTLVVEEVGLTPTPAGTDL